MSGWMCPGLWTCRRRVSTSRISFPVGLETKGKGKDVGMSLLCPTRIRRNCAVEFWGIDSSFWWDTLGLPGRFFDWPDDRITVKESTSFHPLTGEPSRQTNQRVDGGPIGCFRPENAKLVELVDYAGCRLPVTIPQSGKIDLGSYELSGV